MSWLGDIFRSRRTRKHAAQLAPVVLRLLSDDKKLRQLALENQDEAFDQAVKLAAAAAGIDVDAELVRLTVCAVMLERIHHQLLVEQLKHEREIARIKAKYAR